MSEQGPIFRKGGTNQARIEWWLEREALYPFHAKAPTAIKPDMVPGDHISVSIRPGWRIWGFKFEAERDTFCLQFKGVKMR